MTGSNIASYVIVKLLTGDDQVSVGANRLDSQVTSDLALVVSVVGQRRVGDPQIENTGALIADQPQPGMTHDLAGCGERKRREALVVRGDSAR